MVNRVQRCNREGVFAALRPIAYAGGADALAGGGKLIGVFVSAVGCSVTGARCSALEPSSGAPCVRVFAMSFRTSLSNASSSKDSPQHGPQQPLFPPHPRDPNAF